MHVDLKLLQDIQCEAPPSRSCWATSSNSLACALGPRSYLFFDFDAHSKVLDSTHQLDEDISALALSPCGTVLLLGTTEGHLLRVSQEAIDANTAASTSPTTATEQNHIHPTTTGTSDRICAGAGAAAGSSAFSSDAESRCPRHGEHCSAASNNITIDLIGGFREEDGGKGKSNIAVRSVACNEEGMFAIARGKGICLVNKAGKVVEVLGPLASEVIAIGWSKKEGIEGGTVVAITCDELCAWHAGDPASNVKIEHQGKGLFAGLATSPKNSLVVAYNDQGDVHCWDINLLMKERSMDSKKTDLLSFGTSLRCQQPVRYLSWDSSGSLLGISDNSNLKIWRRSDISSHTSKSNPVECYKFYAEPPITYFDFALDGQLFASASEDGQTTVYLSNNLQYGEMDRLASIAKESWGFREAIRGLAWISRNRLIAFSEDGRLSACQMNMVKEGIDAKEMAADDATESNVLPSQALFVSDQKQQRSELQNACHDICDVHTDEEHNSKHEEADRKEVRQDTIAVSVSSSKTAHDERSERSSSVDISHSLSTPLQAHPSQGGTSAVIMPRGRTNEPQRSRPLRTQVSGGRKASMNPAKGGGPSRGVSQTLLQHLQNMRESPAGPEHAAALEAQENLTGWGLGYPGGASIPWMSGFSPQAGVLTGQDLATANLPQNYVSPAHVQYIYTPYGGMSMVPSPGSSPTGFAPVPPVGGPSHSPIASPQAMSQYAQNPFYYQHLYRQAYQQQIPHSPRTPPSAVTGGTTLVQAPQHPMASSSAGATSYAMPYSQMHQWAGTAPGYMAYQHSIRPSGSQRSTGSSQGIATPHHQHHASESLLKSGGPEKIRGIRGHEANAWSDSSQYQASSYSPSHASISPAYGDMHSGRKPPFRFEGMRKHLQSEHAVVEPPPGLGLLPKNIPQTGPASLSRKGIQRHACREAQTKNTESGVGGPTDDTKEQGGPVEEEKTQLRRDPPEEAASKHSPRSVSVHEVMKQERMAFSEFSMTPEPPTPPSLSKANNKVSSPAEDAAAAPEDETTPKTKAVQRKGSGSMSSVCRTGNHVAYSQKTTRFPKSRESGPPDVVHVAQTHLDSGTKSGDGADDDLEEEGHMMTGEAASTVYIGNLTPAVDEYALAWLSGHFGPVKHVQIIRDKTTHVSRGFGFVTFQHPAYATLAMQQLNGQVMHGPFGGQRLKAAPTNKRD